MTITQILMIEWFCFDEKAVSLHEKVDLNLFKTSIREPFELDQPKETLDPK